MSAQEAKETNVTYCPRCETPMDELAPGTFNCPECNHWQVPDYWPTELRALPSLNDLFLEVFQ